MRYQQKDFSEALLETIRSTERALKDHIEHLLLKYKPAFVEKNVNFAAGFDQVGSDPFEPIYSSSVSIGIAEGNKELDDLLLIKIWECERSFLGIPTSKKILGSKIIGELLDETIEDVKDELEVYIKDILIFGA
ncbi:hypothetical protein JOC78_003397 [Bacillus ectoiniformans]|uniref:hypothetical protein n=1 Tax=Bacillus ectoiniformans TaxID=1494429 RepID=UPI001956A138|nr:hypothetical protein [Bacillus ectoiniformans]MBM7650407.1 hypothetical protein [Bacillus ectoiniformans]